MKCEKCGAENPEGVRFCTNCSAPVSDAFQVEQTAIPDERNPESLEIGGEPAVARKGLIVPGILAAIVAAFLLYQLVANAVNLCRNVADPTLMISGVSNTFFTAIKLAAALLLCLFCLIQYRKEKKGFFAASCLLTSLGGALSIYFAFVQPLLYSHVRRAASVSDSSVLIPVYIAALLLQIAVIVLFLIEAIIAFRGRIHKGVGIVCAVTMILSAVMDALEMMIALAGIRAIPGVMIAVNLLSYLPIYVLAVAYLLTAVRSES